MTYFRTHKSTGARSAFVKYENATLGGFGLQLAVGSAPRRESLDGCCSPSQTASAT